MIRRTLTEADAKNPGIIAETITALWGRLTALEKSACSPASPAPSSSPTTSSSGSCLSSSSCSSSTSSVVDVADPSALIRADPNRPGWLKDEMLPLPVGTERVRGDRWGYPRAYPVNRQWTEHSWSLESFLEGSDDAEDNGDTGEVYHVPQPAPADKPVILPPAEMPEALRPYWTPESRVWEAHSGGVWWVYPSNKSLVGNRVVPATVWESEMRPFERFLPNRTVPADPLDQLAAEAQAEGEYETAGERCRSCQDGIISHFCYCTGCGTAFSRSAPAPKPLRPAGEVAEEIVQQYEASVGLPTNLYGTLVRLITEAIERDRGSR